MRCHICHNELECNIGKPDFSRSFGLQCRSPSCPMRKLVDQCNLTYHPEMSKYFFSYASF